MRNQFLLKNKSYIVIFSLKGKTTPLPLKNNAYNKVQSRRQNVDANQLQIRYCPKSQKVIKNAGP